MSKFTKYSCPLCHFMGYNLWILKPTGLNRGRGIHVFGNTEELKDYITNNLGNENTAKRSSNMPIGYVIQKYIESPLLIRSRKFDIRMWVLVMGDINGYLFREGYIRTSSTPFTIDPDNTDDKYVHLTNNAIQKYSTSYGSFEDGNQLSFDMFKSYIGESKFNDLILPQMKEIIIKSLLSTRKKLNPQRSRNLFEIFGYDFLIDRDYNVWLIEVNTNPCLEESSFLLKMLLPRMIDDAFKLTIDKSFPRPKEYEKAKIKYPVKGYEDDINMW